MRTIGPARARAKIDLVADLPEGMGVSPSCARNTLIIWGRSEKPVSAAIWVAEREVVLSKCLACSMRINRSASEGHAKRLLKVTLKLAPADTEGRDDSADREWRVDGLLHGEKRLLDQGLSVASASGMPGCGRSPAKASSMIMMCRLLAARARPR